MSNYPWLEDFCSGLPGAVMEFKTEWDCVRFLVGGKMFALVGADNQNRPIVTFKLRPEHGEQVRAQYADVLPGYYMNKTHWNSALLAGAVPDDDLRSMLAESHALIVASLPKKVRDQIASR